MRSQPFMTDIAVLGGGFGGCLIARILGSLGYRVTVFEQGSHPRFTIGESSTPIADCVLRDLCRRYGLNDLLPLTQYSSAKRMPNVVVGPKRGFTYIDSSNYQPGQQQVAEHEMLVAASTSLESADTHWHRASVDQYFARSLEAAGIEAWERTRVERVTRENPSAPWELHISRLDDPGESLCCRALGIIDASGRGSPLGDSLALEPTVVGLRTRSGAIFGHVRDWVPLSEVIGGDHQTIGRHPYPMDQAALHHVVDDGWLWQLAFDNSITSVGWCVAPEHLPRRGESRDAWWRQRLRRSPWLERQASSARRIEPQGDWALIERMQFTRRRVAGAGWWMLPGAAGFIDPLHSSGIAHTMVSIERLARAFEVQPARRLPPLEFSDAYDATLRLEIEWLDRLVAACYRALPRFGEFTTASMLYFAATVAFEQARLGNEQLPANSETSWQELPAFLKADDPRVVGAVSEADAILANSASIQEPTGRTEGNATDGDAALRRAVAGALAEINHAGLLAEATHPYYAHTAPGKP